MNKITKQPVKDERYETPEVRDIAPVSIVKGDFDDDNQDSGVPMEF